jgi:flagellin-like protein
MARTLRNRRGISPAITSIILIGVAVAAGISGYSVFVSTANTASLKGTLIVEDANLLKQANGEMWLSVTIKNSGNKAFSSNIVNLHLDTNPSIAGIQPFVVTLQPSPLNPGQTASASAQVIDSAGFAITWPNIGDALPIEIVSTGTDGSTVREITSILVGIS